MSLGKLAMKSSMWSLAANSGQQVLQFAFFIFLARLLEPKAFGLVAMAMVAIDVLTTVGRMGLMETLVQRKEESPALLNKAFWLLQAVGLTLTGIVVLFSGTIARAYDTPELQTVIQGFAVIIWLQSLSVVHEARLRRQFKFKNLAARTLAGTMAGSALGLGFALMGMGVMSLVFQRVSMIIIQTGILWSADNWRPSLKVKAENEYDTLPVVMRHGLTLMMGQVVMLTNNRMVDVVVGFFMGPVALGYLRVAWRIFDFVLQFAVYPITGVALSTFSRMQSDPKRLKRAYLRMVEVAALVTCPTFFGLAGVAALAIPLLFGEKWAVSAPLMQGMSLMALAAIINVFFAPIMTSVGQAKQILRQGLIQLSLTLCLTIVAAQWSLLAVVLAHATRALLVALLNMKLQSKYAQIPVKDTLLAMWQPLSVALTMGVLVWGAQEMIVTEGFAQWFELGGLIVLGVGLYASLMALFFRKHLKLLAKDTLQMLRGNGNKPVAITPAAAATSEGN